MSVCAASVLSGCAYTVSKAALDPKAGVSVERSLEDVTAARAIRARMLRADGHDLNDVSVDVVRGIVVLAGAAPNPADKTEAGRIAASAPGVVKVGNEIYVGRSQGLGSKTKDEFISTTVRTRLASSNNVRNLNYSIETRGGIVYLMGVARSQAELEEAARLASITKGVREVISYVSVKSDMPNSYGSGSAPSSQSSIASAPMPYSAPYSAPQSPSQMSGQSTADDVDFWGTPVDQAPIDNAALPSLPSTPIDPSAPLPYRPGITELDADALESGAPVLRDLVTGEEITLPPGVTPLPYIPDAPGSLGAGGVAPPPGAVINSAPDVSGPVASLPIGDPAVTSGPMTLGQMGEDLQSLGNGTSVRLTEPYTIDPNTGNRIPIKWDGKQWVGVIK